MSTAEQLAADDVEFWPLKTVIQKVGLSRTEIYRQQSLGKFPRSRSYRNNPGRRFWLSTEVRHWQAEEVEGAPVLQPGLDPELEGLIG